MGPHHLPSTCFRRIPGIAWIARIIKLPTWPSTTLSVRFQSASGSGTAKMNHFRPSLKHQAAKIYPKIDPNVIWALLGKITFKVAKTFSAKRAIRNSFWPIFFWARGHLFHLRAGPDPLRNGGNDRQPKSGITGQEAPQPPPPPPTGSTVPRRCQWKLVGPVAGAADGSAWVQGSLAGLGLWALGLRAHSK